MEDDGGWTLYADLGFVRVATWVDCTRTYCRRSEEGLRCVAFKAPCEYIYLSLAWMLTHTRARAQAHPPPSLPSFLLPRFLAPSLSRLFLHCLPCSLAIPLSYLFLAFRSPFPSVTAVLSNVRQRRRLIYWSVGFPPLFLARLSQCVPTGMSLKGESSGDL